MSISRRSFFRLAAPLVLYSCVSKKANRVKKEEPFIMTVTGPVTVTAMGLTLTHEHLFSIFGMEAQEKTTYNIDELQSAVLPFLQTAKSAGCKTH